MRYKLHKTYIHCLELHNYNLKWDFSWNDQISIKDWKYWRKLPELRQHSRRYLLIFCKKTYRSKYVDVWLKIEKLNHIINWKEFTIDSTNSGWELNPGHFFRYHTSRPARSHRYCQYSLHEQISECLYHMYMKTFHCRNLSTT